VPTPADAHVSEAVGAEIDAIARLPRTTFGVVSGRRVDDVHHRVGRTATFTAGLHGLQIDGPDAMFRHPVLEGVAPIIESVFQVARRSLDWCPGAFLEDKTYSLTCHVRGVPPPIAERVLEQFVAIAKPHVASRVLKLLPGAEALELMPVTDWHKGRAVEWIAAHMAARTTEPLSVLYLGDDRTDEDAFHALGDDDIAIGVGERPHEAMIDWRLAGPPSVGRFLGHLARLRRGLAAGRAGGGAFGGSGANVKN
jgi:trehalose-phosphatase